MFDMSLDHNTYGRDPATSQMTPSPSTTAQPYHPASVNLASATGGGIAGASGGDDQSASRTVNTALGEANTYGGSDSATPGMSWSTPERGTMTPAPQDSVARNENIGGIGGASIGGAGGWGGGGMTNMAGGWAYAEGGAIDDSDPNATDPQGSGIGAMLQQKINHALGVVQDTLSYVREQHGIAQQKSRDKGTPDWDRFKDRAKGLGEAITKPFKGGEADYRGGIDDRRDTPGNEADAGIPGSFGGPKYKISPTEQLVNRGKEFVDSFDPLSQQAGINDIESKPWGGSGEAAGAAAYKDAKPQKFAGSDDEEEQQESAPTQELEAAIPEEELM